MNNTRDLVGAQHAAPVHQRHSFRLRNHNYVQPGAYFLTICVQRGECLLGQIVDGRVRLDPPGTAVRECWLELPRHYAHVESDAFVAMPNHVHGIIVLTPEMAVGAGLKPAPTRSAPTKRHPLPEIVRAFKTFSSRRINQLRGVPGVPVWQRNYYEHVIRNEDELNRIRQYILDNPARWALDPENPAAPVGVDAVGAGLKPAPTDDIDTILDGVTP